MNDITSFTEAFSNLILSASGFRTVFADNEESFNKTVSFEKQLLCACIAKAFSEFYIHASSKKLLIATDARPTGGVLTAISSACFKKFGISVCNIGIASAPEAMCFASLSDAIGGFCYISASHNPIGHNGFKFGLKDGGVLDGETVGPIIDRIRTIVESQSELSELKNILTGLSFIDEKTEKVDINAKESSLLLYERFLIETAYGADSDTRDAVINSLKINPIGIVGELNGSARSVSADKSFFNAMSVKAKFYNDIPGQVVHPIVPEGENLSLCRELLEKAHAEDPSFLLGYVPDNDGDRGNIVYIDENSGKAHILTAQNVFALSVLSELLYLRYLGAMGLSSMGKTAVIVNGPTSMRVDDIAEMLDASVFRSEVGEANAVKLAKLKQKEGFHVRILGEGSNGGNITFPSAVRDPLNTVMSFIKLLRLNGDEQCHGLFRYWCGILKIPYTPFFGIADILSTIPRYITTDAFSPVAKMQIRTLNHGILKDNYELLLSQSDSPFPEIIYREFGNVTYEIINYEGVVTRVGRGNRSGQQRGGFKVLLRSTDIKPEHFGYLWMRGSGTEPVFRVLVDVRTDNREIEAELLAWHREMIAKADEMSQ